jgi:hypothetical protein
MLSKAWIIFHYLEVYKNKYIMNVNYHSFKFSAHNLASSLDKYDLFMD